MKLLLPQLRTYVSLMSLCHFRRIRLSRGGALCRLLPDRPGGGVRVHGGFRLFLRCSIEGKQLHSHCATVTEGTK